ncbi:hypothetical protein [Streptomyces sp. NPDC058964]|uniref:hypothetical protein n=1 Tax=Streptomyces sp. NPDC058964 TaxID=3346681 RepID=UPI00369112CD
MSGEATLPREALTGLLADLASTGAVTLKNGDLFANWARGGDWDVLVRDLPEAESKLVERLGLPDRVSCRSYVRAYFYPWGEIDLLPDWNWRGARLLDRAALFAAAEWKPAGVFPVVGIAHEATIAWFNSILWAGVFNPRYASVVERAVKEDPRRFQHVLQAVFGARWRRRLWRLADGGRPGAAVRDAAGLRRAVLLRALARNPLGTVAAWVQLWSAEITLRRRPVVPWVWADCRNADAMVERIRALAAQAGSGLAGVRLYSWPEGPAPFSLLKALLQYWGPLVKDRANGQLVVFVPGSGSSWSVTAYRWMSSSPDLDLRTEKVSAEQVWRRLRGEMQRRAAALVGAGTGSR